MGYDSQVAKICRLQNGFEVEIYEPSQKKADPKKSDSCCPTGPYDDPWKAYAFTTLDEVMKFMKEKLPSLTRKKPGEEFDEAFDEAAKKK